MVQLKDEFLTIETACTAIKTFILDEGESYRTIASDKERFIVGCKFSNVATKGCPRGSPWSEPALMLRHRELLFYVKGLQRQIIVEGSGFG
jgi:hypothetical protein